MKTLHVRYNLIILFLLVRNTNIIEEQDKKMKSVCVKTIRFSLYFFGPLLAFGAYGRVGVLNIRFIPVLTYYIFPTFSRCCANVKSELTVDCVICYNIGDIFGSQSNMSISVSDIIWR